MALEHIRKKRENVEIHGRAAFLGATSLAYVCYNSMVAKYWQVVIMGWG